jgi:hypothetical protein
MTPLACLVAAYFVSLSLGGFVAVRRIFWWLDRG